MSGISVFRYSLKPVANLNSKVAPENRAGALLKVDFGEEQFGYADLFPWPEFGDSDLDQQLEFLKRGQHTELLRQSLWLAERDFRARLAKTNLLPSQPKVKNHYLVTELLSLDSSKLAQIKELGFTTLKLKMSSAIEQETKKLVEILETFEFSVRLDFNSCLNWNQFETFIKSLSFDHRHRIEFIEDPLPWNPTLWKKASQFVPLALDFEFSKVQWHSLMDAPFRYLILKPARQNVADVVDKALEFSSRIVVTSSQDHALGIVHAAGVAEELVQQHPDLIAGGGLLTHQVYQEDGFFSQIQSENAVLRPVPGYGVGFDTFLQEISWQKWT